MITIHLTETDSSLIRKIEYDEDNCCLKITFKETYYIKEEIYSGISIELFEEFALTKSFGRFYTNKIKNKFKKQSTMSEEKKKPRGINKAGNFKRFIKLNINLKEIDREWLVLGEHGNVYLNATLMMKPDGEVDRFGHLGMIVQEVPKEIYIKDKTIKGPILGNGIELAWDEFTPEDTKPMSQLSDKEKKDVMDDLPF